MADFGGAGGYPSPPTLHSPPGRKPSLPSLYEQTQSLSSSGSPQPGDQSGSGDDKGPLQSLNLDFIKTLTERRLNRDGHPSKRRGPKPDSKPALTRRQELNRQAQRTHRERKELYIKALEDEVLRLREVYTNASQEKDKLAEENEQLKALLQQNGLVRGSIAGMSDMSTPSLGYPSSASPSNGFAAGSATSPSTAPSVSASSPFPASNYQPSQSTTQQQGTQNPVDYEQAGIDFVLTLEHPCMEHMPFMVESSMTDADGAPHGHALMASCPPEPFSQLSDGIPFGYGFCGHQAPTTSGSKTWELSKGSLTTLLNLSSQLNLGGEITPVMAWGVILAHPRFAELNLGDFRVLADELKTKVGCYGFGAVLEEFEVRDALNSVFANKPDMMLF